MFDHVQTEPVPTDEITFEAFVGISALASETARVRLGHLVLCAGYRNPALVAKMISTLDVVSGGRAELGLGAGWKEDEYPAYGFGFPPLRTRMEMLEDALEIATRMLAGGRRATYEGPAAAVHDAINVPRGLQEPRIPILVGGNGPNRTWRLAARFADELNLDWLTPRGGRREPARDRRSRCAEIGRDPATLRVSVNIGRDALGARGRTRVDLLRRYRDAGVDRVMTLVRACADDDGALERFAEDCVAAGCELRAPEAAPGQGPACGPGVHDCRVGPAAHGVAGASRGCRATPTVSWAGTMPCGPRTGGQRVSVAPARRVRGPWDHAGSRPHLAARGGMHAALGKPPTPPRPPPGRRCRIDDPQDRLRSRTSASRPAPGMPAAARPPLRVPRGRRLPAPRTARPPASRSGPGSSLARTRRRTRRPGRRARRSGPGWRRRARWG